ncbi:MAG: 1-aminocyclopropane-1-carboxylate deaminase/D-cysteine desulfhydrase, partial [Flavobacteriaceae bacterium]
KTPPELIEFINDFKKKFTIPLDPIYTGKMLFGIFDLINKGLWRWGNNVLVVHTGGLQGIAGVNQRLAQKGATLLD